MTLTQEFEQQWSTLTNSVTTEILSNANQGKSVSHDRLEQLFNNEKKRWLVRGQYQYAWLELLRKKNADTAAEFEKALEAVKLMPIIPAEKPSSSVTAGSVAGGAVVGFGLAKLMTFSTVMTILGTAAIGAMGFGIGNTIRAKKLTEALSKDCDAYKVQLQKAGKELAAIVSHAEQ